MLMEINRKLVFGEEIPDVEKKDAVAAFLNVVCDKEEISKYKKRMRVNAETDNIYPYFYIPPYNANKKLRLVQGYLPKTNILYANHYELENIRLLYMFSSVKNFGRVVCFFGESMLAVGLCSNKFFLAHR